MRGPGEISDPTRSEKRERIVSVCHGQVQPHAEGAQGTAEPFKRESPDERPELQDEHKPRQAGHLWEAEESSPVETNEVSV